MAKVKEHMLSRAKGDKKEEVLKMKERLDNAPQEFEEAMREPRKKDGDEKRRSRDKKKDGRGRNRFY